MSCLFNSISHHLGITGLREKVVAYVKANPNLEIEGTSIKDWLTWAAQDRLGPTSTMDDYLHHIEVGHWGGGPEIAVLSRMYNVNIFILKHTKVIARFQVPKPLRTIQLQYTGSHYTPRPALESSRRRARPRLQPSRPLRRRVPAFRKVSKILAEPSRTIKPIAEPSRTIKPIAEPSGVVKAVAVKSSLPLPPEKRLSTRSHSTPTYRTLPPKPYLPSKAKQAPVPTPTTPFVVGLCLTGCATMYLMYEFFTEDEE